MERKSNRPAPKGQETRAISPEEYKEIIDTMRQGGAGFNPNERAAMALILEANLGIRISDICKLRLCDIIRENGKWRLSIVEQKTGKLRTFRVPDEVRQYIVEYCYRHGVKETEPVVQIARRSVQDALKKVTNYLDMERVGTHSFRKYFATQIYENTGHDVALVREILQHSSLETTQRYLKINSAQVEEALKKHVNML